jgi:hypothetical protein
VGHLGFRLPATAGKRGSASRPTAERLVPAGIDDDGRMQAVMAPELCGAEVPFIEVVIDAKVRVRGIVKGPIEIQPGDNDLGRVMLVKPTEVVSGSVFDERNRPVMAAKVQLVEALESPTKLAVHEVKHAPRSRFVVTAWVYEPITAPLHLRVTTDYMTPQPDLEFALGTKNLVVILTLGSHLVAEVVLPDGVRAERLGAVLRRAGSSLPITPSFWSTARDGGAGEVRWFGLAAGTYDLLVQPPSLSAQKLVLAGLRVPEGGRCFDERLVNLDLRALRDLNAVSATRRARPRPPRA